MPSKTFCRDGLVGPNPGKYLHDIDGILRCSDGYEDWVPGEALSLLALRGMQLVILLLGWSMHNDELNLIAGLMCVRTLSHSLVHHPVVVSSFTCMMK